MNDIRAKILWWAVKRRVEIDKPFIIAITGSIAKTSTKSAIGQVVNAAYPGQVRVGYGNLNSYLGVPLAILGFKIDFFKQKITWQWIWILKLAIWRGLFGRLPKYLVLEFGADKPGDIKQITEQIKPDIAAVTLVGPAHLENYPSEEAIAKEKGLLLSAIKEGGVGFINKNDRHLKTLMGSTKERLIQIDCPQDQIAVEYARAIGKRLRVDDEKIEKALLNLKPVPGRMEIVALGNWQLLDDSYNANPLSMETALKKLKEMPGKKIAILGSMLELGPTETDLHTQVGKLAHQSADLVIGVGELAKHYKGEHWFETSAQAVEQMFAYLGDGGSILVKGSHGVHMEKIVEALKDKL